MRIYSKNKWIKKKRKQISQKWNVETKESATKCGWRCVRAFGSIQKETCKLHCAPENIKTEESATAKGRTEKKGKKMGKKDRKRIYCAKKM